MASIDNLDFLNLNSLRNYPIKEGLSRIDSTGAFEIPNDFIVDAQIAATYDVTKRFYISKFSNFEDYIIIEISDDADVIAGSFTINTTTHTVYQKYEMTPTVDYGGATGILVIGDLGGISGAPAGSFVFTLATTELEARAVVPGLRGVNRLIFVNTAGQEFTLTGDVKIEARTNLRFKLGEDNRVILDAGNDIGLNVDCGDDARCIETINLIPPDEDGNFTLDFSDCAALTPIPANTGLLLQDTCCKPCMGCDDITELTERLTALESSLLGLRNYYDSLNQIFDNFKTTVNYTCDC